MTALFPVRRRAEDFDALVGGSPSTSPHAPLTERDVQRFADLLAVVDDLRAVPPIAPRPHFTTALRERLMAEAETVLVAQPARVRAEQARLVLPARARDRRLATLLGGAALIGATTSMAVAAQTALPGDSLYPVKRALEDARTGLTTDEAARGARLLAQATGRLDEVDRLARSSSSQHDAAVADTLVAFDAQATSASEVLLEAYAGSGDEQVIDSLRDFAGASLDRLSALEGAVPESARDELVAAGRLLAVIDARAATACPECGGSAVTLPPFVLTLSSPGQAVGTVLETSSTAIIDRGRTARPALPSTVSDQDVGGVVVPGIDTTLPGGPVGTGSAGGTGGPVGTGGTGGKDQAGPIGGAVPTPTPTGGTVPTPTKAPSPALPTKDTVKTPVPPPVDDVTQPLTGDVPPLVNEVPVVGPVVGPTGDAVGGAVGGATGGATGGPVGSGPGGVLDPITTPLLP